MELVTDVKEVASIKDHLRLIRQYLLDLYNKAYTDNQEIEAKAYLEDAGAIARVIKTLRSA
jgi:hypothetical protein